MKHLIKILIFLLTINITACNKPKNTKTIGIILPMEHQALNEIVLGFKTTLTKLYKKPIEFKVANAEGDMNILHSIISKIHDENYDLIVPISTTTSQMTASIIKKQPIIALAADLPEKDRIPKQSCNIAIVDDELSNRQIIAFIHSAYPSLKTLTLIHSTSDKIFPEVAEVKKAALQYNINLHIFMIQNLADLYSTGQAIPNDSEAIFILKDSLIASGIETLIKIAKEHKIPLITSDDGTVKKGATFAVGVHEQDIGNEGAKLALAILNGKNPCSLPITKMTKPTVFINKNIDAQNFSYIEKATKKANLQIEFAGSRKL